MQNQVKEMKKLFLTFFCLMSLIFSYCLGSDFSPPVLLSENETENISALSQVAMNDTGAAVLTWFTEDPSGLEPRANVYVSTRSSLVVSAEALYKLSRTRTNTFFQN